MEMIRTHPKAKRKVLKTPTSLGLFVGISDVRGCGVNYSLFFMFSLTCFTTPNL